MQKKTNIKAKAEIAETKESETICFSYGRPTRRCASNLRAVTGGSGTSQCQSDSAAAGKLCYSRTMSRMQQANAKVRVESPGCWDWLGDKPAAFCLSCSRPTFLQPHVISAAEGQREGSHRISGRLEEAGSPRNFRFLGDPYSEGGLNARVHFVEFLGSLPV